MADRIISFVRKKDFVFVKELGKGACARTVVLHDDVINETFVCKKFSPIDVPDKDSLFENFIREIKILHMLHHINVVRVFNYYLYPESLTGYILMEKVNGYDIEEYIKNNPMKINEIFKQTIDGFAYLEDNNILHRDIRPQNIMVSDEGVVKIIDFGFGKEIYSLRDFDKSISLNWWCEPPKDFSNKKYDFTTEVYFVGKLFEKLIKENSIDNFKYMPQHNKMCQYERENRISSFTAIKREMMAKQFSANYFTDNEMSIYREFAEQLTNAISKIDTDAKYYNEIESVENHLNNCYRSVMLEEFVPTNKVVTSCFVNGSYYFSRNKSISVNSLKQFIDLLKSCGKEKKEIIMANIQSRLEAIDKYEKPLNSEEDDIPF